MQSSYNLKIESNTNPEDVRQVSNGLDEYNIGKVGSYQYIPLNVYLRDGSGKIVAGLLGGTFWDWLHVSYLWVGEGLRGAGWGQKILEAAEAEALRRGTRQAHLETHSFQALDFYKKLGYEVYGELPDFPKGHKKYFLKKSLE